MPLEAVLRHVERALPPHTHEQVLSFVLKQRRSSNQVSLFIRNTLARPRAKKRVDLRNQKDFPARAHVRVRTRSRYLYYIYIYYRTLEETFLFPQSLFFVCAEWAVFFWMFASPSGPANMQKNTLPPTFVCRTALLAVALYSAV